MGKIHTKVLSLSVAMLVGAGAAWASEPTAPSSGWNMEIGARYWYSTGNSTKDLFDTTGSILISRLEYQDLTAHSGEAFFQADHSNGFLVKGYIGGGRINSGTLIDEDFPPVVRPYSHTISEQDGGSLGMVNIDVGYNFWQTSNSRLGAIVGYHYWREEYNAYGCRQTATSGICGRTIPTSVAVISQENKWHSLRLGLVGDMKLGHGLTLSGEAVYARTTLDGVDRHHLRPAINPLPEDGDGDGVMLEALLSYDVTDNFSIGIGGRYWRLQSDGTAHFEESPGGGRPQVLKWDIERYGAFVQGKLHY